jgi:hypothetical protein
MRVSELAYSSRIPEAAQAGVADRSLRLHAGAISLGGAVLIFAAKFVGYQLTGSTAIPSDSLVARDADPGGAGRLILDRVTLAEELHPQASRVARRAV